MNNFPRYGPPFQFYNPYRRNYYQYKKPSPEKPKVEPIDDKSYKKSSSDDDFWFDLFGIKLYSDDVLILSLLFFLYKEEVKDEGLFLALVLLLIS